MVLNESGFGMKKVLVCASVWVCVGCWLLVVVLLLVVVGMG